MTQTTPWLPKKDYSIQESVAVVKEDTYLLETRTTSSTPSTRSTVLDFIVAPPTMTTKPQYSSVQQHDDDQDQEEPNPMFHDDDDDDEEDPLAANSQHRDKQQHPRPRQHSNHHNNNNNNQVVYLLWVVLITLVGAILVGLLLVRRGASNSSIKDATHNDNDNNDPLVGLTHTTSGSSSSSSSYVVSHTSQPLPWDPLNLNHNNKKNEWALPQSPLPWMDHSGTHPEDNNDDDEDEPGGAYLIQPHIVNDTLVFVAEGDLYMTRLLDTTTSTTVTMSAAWKLTTTVGNVRTPRWHPTLPLVAYTATYTAHRQVYLTDFRSTSNSSPRQYQLTYWNGPGVWDVVGWKTDDTLLVAAPSQAVSLPDTRLYEITLSSSSSSSSLLFEEGAGKTLSASPTTTTPLQITPIPLAQAIDGVYYPPSSSSTTTSTKNQEDHKNHQDCLVFTRVQQSSHTIRYVGGTAESLWLYCHGQDQALALTHDYNGTSKHAQFYRLPNDPEDEDTRMWDFVLFLSDRSWNSETASWYPTTMNLWALPLSTTGGLEAYYDHPSPPESPQYSDQGAAVDVSAMTRPIALTQISCDLNGQSLQEYSVDAVTGRIVLRVGADLYTLSAHQMAPRLRYAARQVVNNNNNDDKNPGTTDTASLPPLVPPTRLSISVFSDFHETHERLIPLQMHKHFEFADVIVMGDSEDAIPPAALLTVRGQAWMTPRLSSSSSSPTPYQGGGQNLPGRTYRLAPSSLTGGSLRVLVAKTIPPPQSFSSHKSSRTRWAVILATNPKSPTAELAFYVLPSHPGAPNSFSTPSQPPPLLEEGLGSIYAESVVVSPCGRRLAWADTNGRICVMNLPLVYQEDWAETNTNSTTNESGFNRTNNSNKSSNSNLYTVLPSHNEYGEPMVASHDLTLTWSPGGRYLAVNHLAQNQFFVITLVDCGLAPSPQSSTTTTTRSNTTTTRTVTTTEARRMTLGRAVQVTPSRFNSVGCYFGSTRADTKLDQYRQQWMEQQAKDKDTPNDDDNNKDTSSSPSYSTLYFLTDRNVMTDTSSPWGTRMPLPHFSKSMVLYALPLDDHRDKEGNSPLPMGRFSSGGAMEVMVDRIAAWDEQQGSQEKDDQVDESLKNTDKDDDKDTTKEEEDEEAEIVFPNDVDIEFGDKDLSLARTAYRVVHIPKDRYISLLSQTSDGSFVFVSTNEQKQVLLKIFAAKDYPSDAFEDAKSVPMTSMIAFGLSTCGKWVILVHKDGELQVVSNTLSGITAAAQDKELDKVASDDVVMSVWPQLEYQQMYSDAWRMLRDYFYDADMHKVNWEDIHKRYAPLVARVKKREDLDDILGQMASELSALHVFVSGGEYSSPFKDDRILVSAHEPASLGATLQRSAEWNGYLITEIAHRDPDYNMVESHAVYSPLSDQALRPSGQKGLQVGDVIVGVNGESAFWGVPDVHMLLRGQAGWTVRLEVLRLASGTATSDVAPETVISEPVVVVPITQAAASDLRYNAWEYQTRQKAKNMAESYGFSVAYIHLRSMSREDMDAFARSYFEDYNKDAMILDLRHNRGGNIDSWISSVLQRKPVYYFGDRFNKRPSGRDMDWNQHFAFNGMIIVVLIDEKTSSDGEGLARVISELELGFLIGKRTWGGGIWLSQDNRLVDGGIASAPEDGVYDEKWGWGLGIGKCVSAFCFEYHGIVLVADTVCFSFHVGLFLSFPEQQGVMPDLEVDNNPRIWFDGKDTQLERAIEKIQQEWQKIGSQNPNPPLPPDKPDMSLKNEQCQS